MTACVCCGSFAVYSWTTKHSFSLARCKQCGLFFVTNIPTDLSPYYAQGYFTGDLSLDGYMDYESDKEAARATYTHYAELLGPGQGKKLLEVGCATGFFLELAARQGWCAEGIDISSYAVAEALAKGFTATATSFEAYDTTGKEGSFGAIVMFDVLEHVADPRALIRKVHTLLAPDGIFACTTPDAGSLWARAWGIRWHAIIPPQHVFFFNSHNLPLLLTAEHLRVAHAGHYGKRFTLPYIARLLFTWTHIRLWAVLARVLARSFFKKCTVPLNVRDTMFVLARKK